MEFGARLSAHGRERSVSGQHPPDKPLTAGICAQLCVAVYCSHKVTDLVFLRFPNWHESTSETCPALQMATDEKYLVLFPENSPITGQKRGAGNPPRSALLQGGDYAAGTASVAPGLTDLGPGFGGAFLGGCFVSRP